MPRERLGSRLGFILLSAGCAIGVGNVWKFPWMVGQYGGGAFVVCYVLFLLILGLPIMTMEFAIGRASQKSPVRAYQALEKPGSKWHIHGYLAMIGNYLLMMFYTTVCGWMLSYVPKMASGVFNGADAQMTAAVFSDMLADPVGLIAWMVVAVVVGAVVCGMGLQKGVERITKWMMATLFVVMLVLCVRAVTLPGAGEGIAFYLVPDFSRLFAGVTPAEQWATFSDAVFAAMGQALFSLSLGMASMEIFGSYIGRERSLAGEAISVTALNTVVAVLAGLIIFPACFAYGISPDAGPGLVFLTLPTVFEQMPLGHLWCTLFFLFVAAAALSSVIAVFEAILRFTMDQWDISRKRAVAINAPILVLLSLPCVFGYNVWSDFLVPGIGDVQSLEDFILSNNILPIGCLLFVLFCTTKRGWGWDKFMAEADRGEGIAFPKWTRLWVKYGVPALILIVFFTGWAPTMQTWLGLA
mgnify:CR=1 FL=1